MLTTCDFIDKFSLIYLIHFRISVKFASFYGLNFKGMCLIGEIHILWQFQICQCTNTEVYRVIFVIVSIGRYLC